MTFEEEFIFRRSLISKPPSGYNWAAWNDPSSLPLGLAAFTTFLIGWAGAILCMSQVYFIGPIAKMIPGDIGLPVAAAWTAICYPGLRVSSSGVVAISRSNMNEFSSILS